jgi:HlyD family secretion protein
VKKKILISLFIFIVIVGAILAFTVFKNGKNTAPVYKMEVLKKGNIEAVVVTTGTLNPVTLVDVGSQVSGKIEKIYVDFNSHVKKGQIIAQIEQTSFLSRVNQNDANFLSSKASLDKSEVALLNAEKKFNRSKELFEKELISFEEYETSETQYYSAKADVQSNEARLEQAKSQLEAAKIDLNFTVITAPIDGVVINRNVNEGQTVAASFSAPVLFQIANDLGKMQVECSVDEADIGKVQENQKVKFSVDAFPNDEFIGQVKQVRYSPVVQSNVVTYTTIVEVDNPDLKLMPGMTAMVSIIFGEAQNVVKVPNSALRFQPSMEEMQKIFEKMMAQRKTGREGGDDAQSSPRQRFAQGGGQGMGRSSESGRTRQARPRVWMLDDAGELAMVFVRTGVTDNTYTEVIGDNLKEGQEVITGLDSGTSSSRDPRSNMRGGMMFMRR